ncbi:MAG: hypothetical protein NVS2B14_15890 [Chamaesiphon sp.]
MEIAGVEVKRLLMAGVMPLILVSEVIFATRAIACPHSFGAKSLKFSESSGATFQVAQNFTTKHRVWKFSKAELDAPIQPCAPPFLTESTAIATIFKLREVQHKAQQIAALSHGKIYIAAMVLNYPNLEQKQRDYTIQVFEQHPDHISTIWFFQVDNLTGAVKVLSLVRDIYLPLEEWRQLQQG